MNETKRIVFVLRNIGGVDAVKIRVRGRPEDFDEICDEFKKVIEEKGLTKEVIDTPIEVGMSTGEIIAIDDNRFCSGGEWIVR